MWITLGVSVSSHMGQKGLWVLGLYPLMGYSYIGYDGVLFYTVRILMLYFMSVSTDIHWVAYL